MITKNRSWSHDSSILNLIGRKTIDWSMFEYGTTIPNNFKEFFNQANGGKEIQKGNGEAVTLLWNGQEYKVMLRNVNQSSVQRQTFQLRYSNDDLKQLMKTTFHASYEYIRAQRPQDQGGNNRAQVIVPEEQAEYIEFYQTGKPFVYEIKLLPRDQQSSLQPNIWWVNQGMTLDEEKAGEFMWAPLSDKRGRSQYHWDTMGEVRKGDIVLNYANGYIQYVSHVVADVEHTTKPESIASSTWRENGRLVRLKYFPLEPQIPLVQFAKDIMNLGIHHGPIHLSAGVKQGYLFRFTLKGLQLIQSKSPDIVWPDFTIFDTCINPSYTEGEDKMNVSALIPDIEIQRMLAQIKAYIRYKGFDYPEHLIENFYLSLKVKPFVILAGVSGTGKTKLVQLFAEAMGATSENKQFTLIPVRPDWSDPSDLVGYKDLSGTFCPGRFTTVLVEASKQRNGHKPYFICLDEMNLARVEHYFSDLLSILETKEWEQDRIVTVPLIHSDNLQDEDKIVYGGLKLPDNVYIVGTVNMDETTYPFSKKVLDRANTIEFNYINLQRYPETEEMNYDFVDQQYPQVLNTFLRSDYLQLKDFYTEEQELVQSTTRKLVKINIILEKLHSHIGFRIRDTICFYIMYNKRFNLLNEDEAFDLQLLQKVLPRIQGSSILIKRVLLQLLAEVMGKGISVDQYLDDASTLYEGVEAGKELQLAKYPYSARKIAFMLRRLEEDGFTSYWLS